MPDQQNARQQPHPLEYAQCKALTMLQAASQIEFFSLFTFIKLFSYQYVFMFYSLLEFVAQFCLKIIPFLSHFLHFHFFYSEYLQNFTRF